jgi:hypothetical protein
VALGAALVRALLARVAGRPGLLALGALAGCGSSQHRVEAAVRRSPLTYFHYAGARWWGHRVTVRVGRVVTSGAWAGATVSVSHGGRIAEQEMVLLRRERRWDVVAASDVDEGLSCRLAPQGVVRGVVGSCSDDVSPLAHIVAPRANRAAAPVERDAVVAAARADVLHGKDRCVRYSVRISRVDDRFALVSYRFVRPYRDCLVGNGVSLFERRANRRWLHLTDASDVFLCDTAPAGVVTSLEGACELEGTLADVRATRAHLRRVRATAR